MLRYLSKRNEDYVLPICTQQLKAPLTTIAKARSNTNAQHDLNGWAGCGISIQWNFTQQ